MTAKPALPPGPRLPASVQTLAFVVAALPFIESCRRRHGGVVTFRTAFDAPFVMVFEPELVREVFKASPDRLHAGEANSLLGPVLGERSLLLLDGADHLRERRLMLPPFHGERMRSYEGVMLEAADRAIDSWPIREPFALLDSMRSLTLEVIMRAVFGLGEGARMRELQAAVRAMLQPVSRRLGVLVLSLSGGRFSNRGAIRRFEQRRDRVDELIYAEIDRRRAAADLEQREDVLSMLLLARDEDGRGLDDRELRDELVTLLVAGHETTATALAWAFDLLLHSPRVRERLERSLEDGDEGYLDAVVKESLRARPVIPGVGRVVHGEPFELGGYTIPPGVEINPSIAVIHRGSPYANPEDFAPERFLGPDPPDSYAWIPFGGGTRRCIGASFASFEMRVVLRRMLERAELGAAQARLDRVERQGITLVPKNGVRVRMARAPRPAVPAARVAA